MKKVIGSKIGHSLGVLKAVDIAGEGVEWRSDQRIRVVIDIQKPLERGRSLTIVKKAHWVSFQSENLPVFYFNYSRIARRENRCPVQLHPNQMKEWRVWLRAEKLKRQGLSWGTRQQLSRLPQGHNFSNTFSSDKTQTEMEGSENGGHPKPHH